MMKGNINSFLQNPDALDILRKELDRRKIILTSLAEDSSKKMDESDREHILKYLRDGYLPERPNNIPCLLKEFASSGSSYSVTRNYLKTFIGKFPGPDNIAEALSQAFGEDGFLKDNNWYPASLNALVDSICRKRNWANVNIGTKVPDSRILGLLKDGAGWFEKALVDGLDVYYKRIESRMTSPELAWDYVTEFSSPIRQFGEALASDYLKNIGFHQYVKPDFHFLREFPQLAGLPEKMKSRDQFIVAWHLSKFLGITAFYLDHLLYEWGRYGNNTCVVNKDVQSGNCIFQEKDLQKMKEKTDVEPSPGNQKVEVSLKIKDAKQDRNLKETFEVTNFPKYSSNASGNRWKPDFLPAATFSSPAAADPLESLVSGKLAILEVSLKQVEEEIEERHTLHDQLVEELDRQLCIQKESLLQVAPHGNMTCTVGDPRRRSAIEKELASLEGDKRHEMVAVWKDVASLKREWREISREFYEERQRQSVMRA